MEYIRDVFLHDLTELIKLKSELFVDKSNTTAPLSPEICMLIPYQLRDYYTFAISCIDIFSEAPVRILRFDEMTIEERDDEKILIFARSNDRYYVYGYSYERSIVMQSHGSIVWSSCFMSDIGNFILFHLSCALLGHFNNIAAVSINCSKATNHNYSEYAAKRIGLDMFRTLHNSYYSAFYHSDLKLLSVFNYDSSKRFLLACDDPEVLTEQLGSQKYRFIKLNGRQMQDPRRYIKGDPPKCFIDKLLMIYNLLYGSEPQTTSNGKLLEQFWNLFGRKKEFLSAEFDLYPLSGDKRCIIAEDTRGALSWAVDKDLSKVYLSSNSCAFIEQDMSVEELLIYISVVQSAALSKASSAAAGNDLDRLRPYFFELSDNGCIKCFAAPDRKLLMLLEGDTLTIAGKTQRALDKLSADSGVEFSCI